MTLEHSDVAVTREARQKLFSSSRKEPTAYCRTIFQSLHRLTRPFRTRTQL